MADDAAKKKAPAKKAAAKKAPAKKATKQAAGEAAAKKTPAKKTPAKKTPAKKTPAEKTPAEKTPAEKTPAKKAAKKAPAEKTPAKKASVEKTTAKKAAKKAAKVEEREVAVPAADHDHDHDHEHEHGELSEEEQRRAEADVERMTAALAAIDDDVLRVALAQMSEKSRQDVAAQLQLPRATMHLGDGLLPLVRRKVRTAGADHQLQVLFALAEKVNDATIEALGDRAEDPSRDDLLEVLGPILEEHPPALVTLMVAGYAASDAPCRPVMRELLDTDERFAIGPAIELPERHANLFAPPPAVDAEELEAKREQRRQQKEAKHAAELRAREARLHAEAKRREAMHKSKRKTR